MFAIKLLIFSELGSIYNGMAYTCLCLCMCICVKKNGLLARIRVTTTTKLKWSQKNKEKNTKKKKKHSKNTIDKLFVYSRASTTKINKENDYK